MRANKIKRLLDIIKKYDIQICIIAFSVLIALLPVLGAIQSILDK